MICFIFLFKQVLEKGGCCLVSQEKVDVKKVVIIGVGFMGVGIVMVMVQVGIEVVFIDVNQEGVDKGKKYVIDYFVKGVKCGKFFQEKVDKMGVLVMVIMDYFLLFDVDFVIEVVFENFELKNKIIQMFEEVILENVVFVLNIFFILIIDLVKVFKCEDQFIGIYFFLLVEKMMLVEIIMGDNMGDFVLLCVIDYVIKIKKMLIVVFDMCGFYVNCCVMCFIGEGMNMLVEGVSLVLIENVIKMVGMLVGLFFLQDEVVLDLGVKLIKQIKLDLGENYKLFLIELILFKMVEEYECFGCKNFKGFYDYLAEKGQFKCFWFELE